MPWPAVMFMVLGAGAAVLALHRRGELRPERLRARIDGSSPFPAAGWLAVGIGVWLAWQIGGGVAASALGAGPAPGPDAPPDAGALRDRAVIALSAGAAGLLAAALAWLGLRRWIGPMGLRARWIDVPLGLGLLALAMPGVFVVGAAGRWLAGWAASLRGEQIDDRFAHSTLTLLFEGSWTGADALWWWGIVLAVAVVAPVFEEVVYRGFLQGSLARAFGSPWAAILGAGALFALVHLGATPVYGLPALFTLGVAMGWATERTGRLGPAVVMHAGFNAANLGLAAAA